MAGMPTLIIISLMGNEVATGAVGLYEENVSPVLVFLDAQSARTESTPKTKKERIELTI